MARGKKSKSRVRRRRRKRSIQRGGGEQTDPPSGSQDPTGQADGVTNEAKALEAQAKADAAGDVKPGTSGFTNMKKSGLNWSMYGGKRRRRKRKSTKRRRRKQTKKRRRRRKTRKLMLRFSKMPPLKF